MEAPITKPKEPTTKPSREEPTLPQKNIPIKLPKQKPITRPNEPLTIPSREKPTKIPKQPKNSSYIFLIKSKLRVTVPLFKQLRSIKLKLFI